MVTGRWYPTSLDVFPHHVMTRVWKPREHTLFRVAAIALFRALIAQCRAQPAPLTAEHRLALRRVVHARFRANKHEVSVRKSKHNYLAGYTALDLLDASAAGEHRATALVAQLLARTPDEIKGPPPPPPPPRPLPWWRRGRAGDRKIAEDKAGRRGEKQEDGKKKGKVEGEGKDGDVGGGISEASHDPSTLADLPPGMKELDVRPRPKSQLRGGEGTRRIPKFALTGKVPFLRLKKPQPASLERVLRQKLRTKQRRVDYMHVLKGFHVPLAEMEDRWERTLREGGLLRGAAGEEDAEGAEQDEPAWVDAVNEDYEAVMGYMDLDKRKTWKRAKRMQEIIDQERELAKQEAEEATRTAGASRPPHVVALRQKRPGSSFVAEFPA